jgi:phosphoribosylanthranilate isomerase
LGEFAFRAGGCAIAAGTVSETSLPGSRIGSSLMVTGRIPLRTRVKICGITSPVDATAAAEFGADAIGLVFYAPSPRAVSVARAREIIAAVPPFVTVVALFLDAETEAVREVLESMPVDLLQFHGRESPAYCTAFNRRYIKALPMAGNADAAAVARAHERASGFLVDSHALGEAGGTGRVFDWGRIPPGLSAPLILAGGLNPDSVGDAVSRVAPYAVDVSSGVESAPGVKDHAKMRAFIDEVRRVQAE